MSTIANLMLIEVVYAYRFIQSINQSGTLPTPPKKVKKKESGNGVDQPTNPYFDQIHTFSRFFLSVNGIGDIGDIMLGRKGSNYYCC